MEEVKDILKSLRKANGYSSAKDFCEAVGISYNTYQNYESGKRMPTADILIKLSDFYGISTDALLGRAPICLEDKLDYATDKIISNLSVELRKKIRELAASVCTAEELSAKGEPLSEQHCTELGGLLFDVLLLQSLPASLKPALQQEDAESRSSEEESPT